MKRRVYLFLLSLLLLNIISWSSLFLLEGNLFKVVFFDVGQGDGMFIVTPDNRKIVIDGGPDYNLMAKKISGELPFWDKKIDVIILTHTDKDHMNGLLGVLEKYEVENILWTGVEGRGSEEKIENWKKMIGKEVSESGAKIFLVRDTTSLIANNMILDFLWPKSVSRVANINDENDYSVVSRLCYFTNCFFFAGDMSFDEEKSILNEKNVKSDILKVAHHGSKYATSSEFLSAVLPKLAVIEVGKNSYGHPSSETMERLEEKGVRVVRTDVNGDIKIFSDGKNYNIIFKK